MPEGKFNEEFDVATTPIRPKFSERMGIRPDPAQDQCAQAAIVANDLSTSPRWIVPRYRDPLATPFPRPDFSQAHMPNGSWDVGIFRVHTRTMMSELSYQIIVELAGRMAEYRVHCDQWERWTPGERKEIFAHTLRGMASTLGRDIMEVGLREMFRIG